MYWGLIAAFAVQDYINNKEREARLMSLREKLSEVKLMLGNNFFNNAVSESSHENGFDSIVSIEKVIRGLETIAVSRSQSEREYTLEIIMELYETDCEEIISALTISLKKGKKSEIKKVLISKIIIGLKTLKNDIDDARAYVDKKRRSRRNGWIAFWVITIVIAIAITFAIVATASLSHKNY